MDTLSREVLRKKSEISEQEAWQTAMAVESSVIASVSEDGWPYATHVSTVVINGTFYFHSAKRGHKHDNFVLSDKCCLTGAIVTNNDERYSYQSFVAYGKIRLVTDREEKIAAYTQILERWDPKNLPETITDKNFDIANWWAVDVLKITGKSTSHEKKQA